MKVMWNSFQKSWLRAHWSILIFRIKNLLRPGWITLEILRWILCYYSTAIIYLELKKLKAKSGALLIANSMKIKFLFLSHRWICIWSKHKKGCTLEYYRSIQINTIINVLCKVPGAGNLDIYYFSTLKIILVYFLAEFLKGALKYRIMNKE